MYAPGVRPHRIEPLWDRVDRNRAELAVFIVLFVLASAAGAALLPTKFALKDMATAAGLPVAPALYVMETSNVNAFVFGKGRRRPVVGITRGLAERLTVDEQRAVFANLVARLRAGDTIWATGVTAIMAPLWDICDRGMTADEDPSGVAARPVTVMTEHGPRTVPPHAAVATAAPAVAWLFPLIVLFVIASELIVSGHRRSQLRHAEVADAEGMLLLKDPRAMLSALEKCVRYSNYVPTAGPGYTQLFYCWTGESSTDDEHDPENPRIARLREVLGVEGMASPVVAPNEPVLAPPAPRLEA